MIGKFENGFDIVHGYRNERKNKFFTKIFNKLLIFKLIYHGSPAKDHGCSIKVLKKELLDDDLWNYRLLAARLNFKNIKYAQMSTNHRGWDNLIMDSIEYLKFL